MKNFKILLTLFILLCSFNIAAEAKNKKNIVSGRFIALKNIDKIAIVQFCFKKQMENTNK